MIIRYKPYFWEKYIIPKKHKFFYGTEIWWLCWEFCFKENK
jgi:hypothetical protein